MAHVTVDPSRVREFGERNLIDRLAFFGSVLRDDFRPESDVDVLVWFAPEAKIGWNITTIQDELGVILGRRVDLRTPAELSPYFRQRVLDEAETFYVRR